MKRKKEILVLVLIIGALSLYLVFQKSDKTHYALPELPEIGKGDIPPAKDGRVPQYAVLFFHDACQPDPNTQEFLFWDLLI